jgi:MazG nucleotide pyrophosphohydrolase domain.
MLISDYDKFVHDTDQTKGQPIKRRRDIAIYGLASEVGSVAAAIKKRLLGEGGAEKWDIPNTEITEELGDVVWYCFALARLANPKKRVNIFIHDINNLQREVSAKNARANSIQRIIGQKNQNYFLRAAKDFPKRTRFMTFEDYQKLAFLTARTKNRILVEVCIAVLYQLSAELFRKTLPKIELQLNQSLKDRPINDIIGEIAWHIAALASIYGLDLSYIAQENISKVSFRRNRDQPTELHDSTCISPEKLPRKFEIAFVTVGSGKSQMYMDGRRLGDQLTDNAYEDDGYRFHDVMHLANAAALGWSPVLRGLMGRKRKSQPKVDEIEDGARAKIVEELVIKAIHTEGQRLAELRNPGTVNRSARLFTSPDSITFGFLKFIHRLISGLEVDKNQYWEWEDAIVKGHEIFHRLRLEEQGTVLVDLDKRSIEFIPQVYIPLAGRVAGLGCASSIEDASRESEVLKDSIPKALSLLAKKRAVLRSLGLSSSGDSELGLITLEERADGEISVRATGVVRQAIWDKKVISFRISVTKLCNSEQCTALALADS